MRKSFQKFAIAIAALVLALSLFVGCGGSYTSPALDGYTSTSSKAVSNGGFVVQKDDWIYFVNGSEDYTAENKFGKVQKGSLMRINQKDMDKGDFSKTDVVVPLLMVSQDYTSGVYVYGDYVYYATPTSTKNTDGVVENSWLDFKSSKLDGSSTMRDYYFRVSNNATVFRFVEVEGVVYCLYVDSTNTEIHSYNTATRTDTLLVKGYESYVLDSSDVTNPNVYYTMPVVNPVGYNKTNPSTFSYKQVYTVRADATKCPYDLDLSDYTDKDSGEVMEYTNFGTLIFDGIGTNDKVTTFNHNGNTGASTAGFTYTLVKYDNGGLYYTKKDTSNGSSVGEGSAIFYVAHTDVTAQGWNAVTANTSDKNVQLAANTASASSSALFYIENGAHYYMYVDGSKIVRIKVGTAEQAYKAEETVLVYEATGATLLFTEGDFVYYSTSGTNGNNLNRIKFNGAKNEYNEMLSGDATIEPVKYLDIDYMSSWYKPEIVGGYVFFANAATYANNYVYVAKNSDNNADIEAMNDKLEKVNDMFDEIATKFNDISNAAKYYFYTGDKDKIHEEKHASEYKEDALAVFDEFAELKKGAFATDELKDDSGKAYNVESYFYNRIGVTKSADDESRTESLEGLLLSKEEEKKEAWTWQWIAIFVPVGVVVLAGVGVLVFFLIKKKK